MEAARAKKLRPSAAAESAPSAFGARADDAPAAAGPSSSAISAVFLQLLPRIAELLPRNVVACVLRVLCKAAAALRGPQHATVHLSEPVPHAAFTWRWCGPQSLFSTTFKQRQQLEELTARSGVVANLEALVARGDLPRLWRPTSQWRPLLNVAAGAGRLELCRWLVQRLDGAQLPYALTCEAVRGGHLDVCEWLLDRSCCEGKIHACYFVIVALNHGHVALADRLLQLTLQAGPPGVYAAPAMVAAAAHGCDLATLQRLHAEHIASRGLDITTPRAYDLYGYRVDYDCLSAAASSPTSDWAAKVEWLEGLGLLLNKSSACSAAASCTDAVARLTWLQERGHPLSAEAASRAVRAGNAEALRYVLAQGVRLTPDVLPSLVHNACEGGSLEALQVLWGAGGRPGVLAVNAAAGGGHLHILSWLAEQPDDVTELVAYLFRAAAESGSLPLLRRLHERGCPWDATTMETAAKAGSEEALEWLVERGCPMGEDGKAYVAAARQHDLPTLRCLARLGCPFAPDGRTFTDAVLTVQSQMWHFGAVGAVNFSSESLQCLLDVGCPVDWDAVLDRVNLPCIEDWLVQQRPQRRSRRLRQQQQRRRGA